MQAGCLAFSHYTQLRGINVATTKYQGISFIVTKEPDRIG